MSGKSKIEWTEETWNPVRGCSIVSKGCTNCYAMRQAHRQNGNGGAYEGLTTLSKGGPVWTGKIRLVPELLDWPLHKRKPCRIFVNSMSDLFHEDVPFEFIEQVFAIMARCPQHTFQVLTKRPQRMVEWLMQKGPINGDASDYVMMGLMAVDHLPGPGRGMRKFFWPLPNVWLGISAEDQTSFDERWGYLCGEDFAGWPLWLSAEPLLDGIDVRAAMRNKLWAGIEGWGGGELKWVVAGGESGPGARPMHPDWARSLRDQCGAAGVPYFFKQWGAWLPAEIPVGKSASWEHGGPPANWPWTQDDPRRKAIDLKVDVHRVGKRAAGRKLDGRTHDEYPA